MSQDGYYDNIGDIKLIEDTDENLKIIKDHLNAGWLLRKVPEVDVRATLDRGKPTEHEALFRTVKFLLVLPKPKGTPEQPPPTTTGQSTPPAQASHTPSQPTQQGPPVEVRLQSLEFKEYEKDGRSWFSINSDKVSQDIIDFLKKQKDWKYVDEDGYAFILGKSGWINRYPPRSS